RPVKRGSAFLSLGREVRQSERDARQGRRPDLPARAGSLIDGRELTGGDVGRIGDRLPLARFGSDGTYLAAWDDGEPVAHAHISWNQTMLGDPEIQDVFVREHRRREGLGTAVTLAAERAAEARGHRRISLRTSVDNLAARRLY